MRDLVKVIDAIINEAPDLATDFKSLREAVFYSAPEIMGERWFEAAQILNECAQNHPKKEVIAALFSAEQ